MDKELKDYSLEVCNEFDTLRTKYPDQIALTLLSFAVNMRDTDNTGKNIVANMNITEDKR